MSNYVHTGYWIVIMILIVVALSIGVSLDSERSKRIELEVENQKWSACFDSLISSLTEDIAISLSSIDSLLAVPPIDTITIFKYDTIYLPDSTYWDLDSSYLWKVYDSLDQVVQLRILDQIWEKPKYGIDSSEVTDD